MCSVKEAADLAHVEFCAARARLLRAICELERRDDGVYLRMPHMPDERYLRGEFQLQPEDGAVVVAALDARVRVVLDTSSLLWPTNRDLLQACRRRFSPTCTAQTANEASQ